MRVLSIDFFCDKVCELSNKKEVLKVALLDEWKAIAYDNKQDRYHLEKFWDYYFKKEKDVYAILLKEPEKVYKGTVHELEIGRASCRERV